MAPWHYMFLAEEASDFIPWTSYVNGPLKEKVLNASSTDCCQLHGGIMRRKTTVLAAVVLISAFSSAGPAVGGLIKRKLGDISYLRPNK